METVPLPKPLPFENSCIAFVTNGARAQRRMPTPGELAAKVWKRSAERPKSSYHPPYGGEALGQDLNNIEADCLGKTASCWPQIASNLLKGAWGNVVRNGAQPV